MVPDIQSRRGDGGTTRSQPAGMRILRSAALMRTAFASPLAPGSASVSAGRAGGARHDRHAEEREAVPAEALPGRPSRRCFGAP